jgi:hypothetical protein
MVIGSAFREQVEGGMDSKDLIAEISDLWSYHATLKVIEHLGFTVVK